MKKYLITSALTATIVTASGLAMAQNQPQAPSVSQETQVQPAKQHNREDWKAKREAWEKLTPEQKKEKFIEHGNKRIDKDLQKGIITPDDAKTLRAANLIVATKVLPEMEKERAEHRGDRGAPGMPPPPQVLNK